MFYVPSPDFTPTDVVSTWIEQVVGEQETGESSREAPTYGSVAHTEPITGQRFGSLIPLMKLSIIRLSVSVML